MAFYNKQYNNDINKINLYIKYANAIMKYISENKLTLLHQKNYKRPQQNSHVAMTTFCV